MKKISVIVCVLALAVVMSGCKSKVNEDPETLVISADNYLASDKPTYAMIELKKALTVAPQNAIVRERIARVYDAMGDFVAAEIEMRKAVRYGYAAVDGQLFVVDMLIRQGKTYDANELLQALAMDLSSPVEISRWHVLAGELELLKRDHKAAEKSFQRALESVSDSIGAQIGLAKVRFAQGDVETAIALAQAVVEIDPKLTDAWGLLGSIYRSKNDPGGAIDSYSKAIELKSYARQERYGRALAYLQDRKFAEAGADARELAEFYGKDPLVAQIYGLSAFLQGNYDQAAEQFQIAVAAAPDFMQAVYYLGVSYLLTEQIEPALRYLDKVAHRHDVPRRALYFLALAQAKTGSIRAAKNSLNDFLYAEPGDSDGLRLKGNLALLENNEEEAVQLISKILARGHGNETDLIRLGLGFLASGKSNEAIEAFDKARALSPDAHQAEIYLVLKLIQESEFEDAAGQLEKLSGRVGEQWLIESLRGTLAAQQGKQDEARAAFRKAWELKQGNVVVGRSLAKLAILEKDFEQALDYYAVLTEANPKDASILLEHAELLARVNNVEGSIRALEQASRLSPLNPKPWVLLLRYKIANSDDAQVQAFLEKIPLAVTEGPDFLIELARTYSVFGNFDQAEKVHRKLIRKRPESVAYRVRLGMLQSKAAAFDDARKTYAAALKINRKSLDALAGLTEVETASGDYTRAEQLLSDVKRLDSVGQVAALLEGRLADAQNDSERAVGAYGRLFELKRSRVNALTLVTALRKKGDLHGARDVARDWLERDPDAFRVRFILGETFELLGEVQSAIREYEVLADNFPDNAFVLNNLALLIQDVDIEKAVALAERAYQQSSDDWRIADTLGWLLLKAKRIDEALDKLRLAHQGQQSDPTVAYHLAEALVAAGQRDEAHKLLNGIDFSGESIAADVARLRRQLSH